MDSKLQKPDVILIDDDPLIQMTWRYSAQKKGKDVVIFGAFEPFLEVEKQFERTTPIYVDHQLGGGVLGDEVCRQLYSLGFLELYLSTGFPPERFPPVAWIKKVVGKYPPF